MLLAVTPELRELILQKRSSAEITEWIRNEIAKSLGVFVDEISVDAPFSEIGLDSVTSLEVLGSLEEWLNRSLSPRLLGQHGTIRALSDHLAQ